MGPKKAFIESLEQEGMKMGTGRKETAGSLARGTCV
jgi:hypothetical protein